MIEVERVSKKFGSLAAVSDLSFCIKPGEVVGLLGPNGAGKTTTMRLLTGFMPPTSGSIRISGFDLLEKPKEAKKRLGYLPENPPLYPELTVEETLSFAAGLRKIPKREKKEKIERALVKTGIAADRRRLVGHMSKGFRQRVGIAQAIVHQPPFLILDEPTIGLDPKQILEIRELIHQLKGDVAILLSSHILQEIQAVCDRIVMIHKGRLVADAKITELTASQNKRYLVTVTEGDPEILKALRDVRGVREVTEYASGLEEIFLKLTEDA